MAESPVISVKNISKKYRLGFSHKGNGYKTLRDTIANGVKRIVKRSKPRAANNLLNDLLVNNAITKSPNNSKEFWAIKDISFDVQQGEVVGIIGANGAGKSTLLKILSEITEPTEGEIYIKGRIASLLEVGTGFHPELSGRENIFMNGAILGMTRAEIKAKFDEIVAFAEVEKFIDTPVKRYSSGMYVRLAFAVAAHLEPEILLVDEVLAVGDVMFQKKCLGKMSNVAKEGRTVLFVSHNMGVIQQLCSSAMLIQEGSLLYNGKVGQCIDRYLETAAECSGFILDHINYKDNSIKVNTITVNGLQSDVMDLTSDCRKLNIIISGEIDQPMRLLIEARIYDLREQCLAFFTPRQSREYFDLVAAGSFCLGEVIGLPNMNQGEYFLSLYISRLGYPTSPVHIHRAVRIRAEGSPTVTGWVFKYAKGNGWMLLNSDSTDVQCLPEYTGLAGRGSS